MTGEFSQAEVTLIKELGFSWLLDPVSRGSIPEPKVYEIMALECFTDDRKGPAVEALRRAVRAIRNGEYRKTPAFDALCSIGK